jgi:competence ComEA-like helix-hairpin-helix protein
MSWRDFFYFSKGERNALILLLCLITIAGVILVLTNQPSSESPETIPAVSQQTISETSVPNSDLQRNTDSPVSASASSGRQTPPRESTSERISRLTSSSTSFPRTEKFSLGTIVELNTADTTILKKVPGIGSAFANRIVRYRELLGGYYTVQQLAEVYGIDEERYIALAPWFAVDNSFIQKLPVNSHPQDSLSRHPYISYRQARAIVQLRVQKKQLSGWDNLALLDEFTELDKSRILPYLSFE